MPRSDQHAHDAAEREPLTEAVVRLLDHRQIRKRKKCIGVRAQHRPQDAAFHEVAQVILAQRPIAREDVAHRVVLPLERVGRGDAGETAEVFLRQNPNRRRAAARLRVQLFGPFELVRFLALGRRTESFGADHQHRRLRVDVVGRRAAEPRHERARLFAAERAEFSCEDDELTFEWAAWTVRRQ